MAKYRKKPVEIDAIQWTGENQREMFDFLTNGEKKDEYMTSHHWRDLSYRSFCYKGWLDH